MGKFPLIIKCEIRRNSIRYRYLILLNAKSVLVCYIIFLYKDITKLIDKIVFTCQLNS